MQTNSWDYRTLLLAAALISLPILMVIWGPPVLDWTAGAGRVGRIIADRSVWEHKIGMFAESNRTFPDTPMLVQMELYAEVSTSQNEEYLDVVGGREEHFRSAVSNVLRSAAVPDLREPTLTTLKRKMKVALVAAHGSETGVFDQLLVPSFEARKIN